VNLTFESPSAFALRRPSAIASFAMSVPNERARGTSCATASATGPPPVAMSTDGRAPAPQPPDRLLGEELARVARDEHARPDDESHTAELRVPLDQLDRLAVRAPLDHRVETLADALRDVVVLVELVDVERMREQILGLDQLAVLLPVIDRRRGFEPFDGALEELARVHGAGR
jgi:hypothetical protein